MKYSYGNYTDYLIMVVKFWDLLMFDQIFLSLQGREAWLLVINMVWVAKQLKT